MPNPTSLMDLEYIERNLCILHRTLGDRGFYLLRHETDPAKPGFPKPLLVGCIACTRLLTPSHAERHRCKGRLRILEANEPAWNVMDH